MDKIESIKRAIEDAKNLRSPHGADTYDVPALSSLRLRHLMNNLGRLATIYLECGPHKGGLFCATICGNDNLESLTAVDSFESDMDAQEPAQPIFVGNIKKYKPEGAHFRLLVADCFNVDLKNVLAPADLYLYDAGHEEEDQRKALTYYLPVLDDEFIFCVDDWQYRDVKKGTMAGIKECGLEVLFEKELYNDTQGDEDLHLNDEWWRGFYVALLKKKK